MINAHSKWEWAERIHREARRDVADRRAEASLASGEEHDWLMEFVDQAEQKSAAWAHVAAEAEYDVTVVGATAVAQGVLTVEELSQRFGVEWQPQRTEWDLVDL